MLRGELPQSAPKALPAPSGREPWGCVYRSCSVPGETLSVTAAPCHLSQRERQVGLLGKRTALFGSDGDKPQSLLGSPFGGAVWPEARLRGLPPSRSPRQGSASEKRSWSIRYPPKPPLKPIACGEVIPAPPIIQARPRPSRPYFFYSFGPCTARFLVFFWKKNWGPRRNPA